MANIHPTAAAQIATHLTSAFSVAPTQSWIQTFLSTQKPTTPLPSLLATAKVRFLNADITVAFSSSPLNPTPTGTSTTTATSTSASSTSVGSNGTSSSSSSASVKNVLPSNIHDATLPERRLVGPIALQVMGVEDLSKSRWSQIEEIEAAERGESTKGREIIRVVPSERHNNDVDDDGGASGGRAGTCKLLFQDAKGVKVWGIELQKVNGIRVGMNIGSKVGKCMIPLYGCQLLISIDYSTKYHCRTRSAFA